MSTTNKPNRLINEKSPYLLQHAYNPVDWYPWGNEAFEKAKRENKPVLVSVGYSTCHWCHVMAHECFEDEEVAKILNDRFVAIKVDREERPDIDSIYMKVCQILTGQGGWPLNVFLTPDQKPFYAGTYFPKVPRYGRPSFIDVVTQLYDQFIKEKDKVEGSAAKITAALKQSTKAKSNDSLNPEILHKTFQQILRNFDDIYGGVGEAPKFPTPHMWMFLLRYYYLSKNDEAVKMVRKTLQSIANGGIYDHIGYGFARYSTDEEWLVPHFEKMLYDNALLMIAYTEGYQIIEEERFKTICEQIYQFINREMTDNDGGFYSAIDADSEGVEGKYYVWDKIEIMEILDKLHSEIFCQTFNITGRGNFEGHNIPNLIDSDLKDIGKEFQLTDKELEEKLGEARVLLLQEREKRIYPHLDDKILTAWNALMIAALAKAAKVFENQEYLTIAKKAIQFIEQNLIIEGRVMVRYRACEVKNQGYIDDYAFLLWAYLELYEATFDLSWLQKAKKVADQMMALFWDNENGGFFFTSMDAEQLLIRDKEIYDGALPSGNSVAALQLMRLAELTGDLELSGKVEEMFTTFKDQIESYGSGYTYFLQSIIRSELKKKEIVIIGNKDDKNLDKFLKKLQKTFAPNYSILVAEKPEDFLGIADFASEYKMIDNQTTVYICENYSCKQPSTDLERIAKELF